MASDTEAKETSTATSVVPTLPDTIVVYGAGVEAVNGSYKLNDKSIYTMAGVWEDESATFAITICGCCFRCHISVDKPDITLYASDSFPNCVLPPCRGWWSTEVEAANGSQPPILFFGNQVSLDWRLPVQQSFSDFVIDIVDPLETEKVFTTEYHVHKVVLANASKYFSRIFTGNNDGVAYAEEAANKSRIKLEPTIASLFPNFLDYMYWLFSNGGISCPTRPFNETQHVGMFWLADYFEATLLIQDLKETCTDTVTADKICSYVEAAQRLDVAALLDTFLDFCAGNFLKLDFETTIELTEVLSTSSMVALLQKMSEHDDLGHAASDLVAHYCEMHAVDAATFAKLTSDELLPEIDSTVVWMLLEEEKSVLEEEGAATTKKITKLQKRCIDALADDFVEIDTSKNGPLRDQSKAFLHKLLRKAQKRMREALSEHSEDEEGDDEDEGEDALDAAVEVEGEDHAGDGSDEDESEVEGPQEDDRNVRARVE